MLPDWIVASTSLVLLFLFLYHNNYLDFPFPRPSPAPPPQFIQDGIKQCEIISRPPPSPKHATEKRKTSDRFVPGTKGVWLRNATLWTGEKDGEEVLYGVGVYLEGGVIRKIGAEDDLASLVKDDAEVVDLHGAWITPGIVDLHSHMGVDAAPELRGSDDTNSLKSAVLPWLRSLDGFNTHDLAFNGSIAGGITTMLVLPGSAGNIGGQAFVFKPRWTYENTPQSMQVDPPFVISSHGNDTWERTRSWRHIKHACGENPARVYGNTRMDSAYDFRRAYEEGRKLKEEQERWCASPKTQTSPFPNSLEWEVLADVIRGNVKVNIHCYETTDLNSLVRISNEFKFPIAAFHHAHETYLVPDLLKQAYGPPPAVAIFATNARYKREAYRGSEFAPKILADAGLSVVMKSDHPVLDSRYLVYEAAQAHHYGLNFSHAMSSVTTHSAKAMGMDHRLGYVRPGYDADLVVWDSFPLSLGATPKQTYVDGIPQIIHPHVVEKPEEAQQITPAGKFDEEAAEAIASRGDPDLRPKKSTGNIVFENVETTYLPGELGTQEVQKGGIVVVENGEVICVGECTVSKGIEFEMVDLKGGSITPGLITVGSYVGLMEIRQEKSTWDGVRLEVHGGYRANTIDGV
jgi:imidazolonepropionase-like amidohydrolase